MFRKVLVPLDGSLLAEEAIGPASAIARGARAGLALVLAHETLRIGGYEHAPATTTSTNAERAYLEDLAARLRESGVSVIGAFVESGTAVDVIRDKSREVHADLIVMTSHGRTGLSRAWLGSVTDAVIREASVPVLMIRSTAEPTLSTAHPLFRRILVPLDGSGTAASILDAAVALARLGDAILMLLRVVVPVPQILPEPAPPYGPLGMTIPDPAATAESISSAKKQLAAVAQRLADDAFVKAEPLVVEDGSPAQAILSAAHAHQADLIAMTSHGRGGSRLLVGSVADKVLRGGDMPLLIYHPRPAHE
jgi:nucleotide-binding universal stress UspA family protein